MNNYIISYKGSWLGGVAVVRALCEDDAVNLTREHFKTVNFEDVMIEKTDECGVLYNDNGEY